MQGWGSTSTTGWNIGGGDEDDGEEGEDNIDGEGEDYYLNPNLSVDSPPRYSFYVMKLFTRSGFATFVAIYQHLASTTGTGCSKKNTTTKFFFILDPFLAVF